MSYTIRPAALQDSAAILEIYSHYVLHTTISFEEVPPPKEEFEAKIRAARYPFLVCESADGELVGYAYCSRHRERAGYRFSADDSVYIAPNHHRKGIGRRFYEQLIPLLRAQGYYTIFAGVTEPNEKSVGLHESLGFQRIGTYHKVGYKQGRWCDVTWFELPLREYGVPEEESYVK